MGVYNPGVVVQREFFGGFSRTRVNDSGAAELLNEVLIQLKLISLKLDCLQPDNEVIDSNELDVDDLQQ